MRVVGVLSEWVLFGGVAVLEERMMFVEVMKSRWRDGDFGVGLSWLSRDYGETDYGFPVYFPARNERR